MEKINIEEIGHRISLLKRAIGTDVLADRSRVSRPALSRIANGKVPNPGIKTLASIAIAAEVDFKDLLFGDKDDSEMEQDVSFSESYMKKLGIKESLIYTISDDTMSPTLNKNDLLLINTAVTTRDGLNLIIINGRQYVRRIEHTANEIYVNSDNKAYRDEVRLYSDVKIVGEVVLRVSRM